MRYAVLEGKKVVPTNDVILWARNFELNKRSIGYSEFDGVVVSTVFLGVNHGFGGEDIWFETMIFGGGYDGYQKRYSTWEGAEAGHKIALAVAHSNIRGNDGSEKNRGSFA